MIAYGDRVRGFLAVPKNQPGPFGAGILGHERYGLVQHTLDLVAKFAAYGYIGFDKALEVCDCDALRKEQADLELDMANIEGDIREVGGVIEREQFVTRTEADMDSTSGAFMASKEYCTDINCSPW